MVYQDVVEAIYFFWGQTDSLGNTTGVSEVKWSFISITSLITGIEGGNKIAYIIF